jgi:hypothetical protein
MDLRRKASLGLYCLSLGLVPAAMIAVLMGRWVEAVALLAFGALAMLSAVSIVLIAKGRFSIAGSACPQCGYDRSGLGGLVPCPECGRDEVAVIVSGRPAMRHAAVPSVFVYVGLIAGVVLVQMVVSGSDRLWQQTVLAVIGCAIAGAIVTGLWRRR